MSLKEVFCTVPLRERAGPRTSDRFEYQLHWALCHLLGLHASEQDYLITFDYHDDILVFDSESDPQSVAFIQVKTRNKPHWTLNELIKPREGATGSLSSILGRLYDNRLRFPENTSSLTLLSNAAYKVTITGDRDSIAEREICAADLDEASRVKIRKSLQSEHELEEEPEFEPFTFLQVAELPLRGHDTHVKGKLSEFLDWLVPEGRFSVVRAYRVLMDDIRRRNNYDRNVNTFLELVEQKSIGRTEFERMLNTISAQREPEQAWRDIEARLHAENVGVSALYRLKNAWMRLEVDRMNFADAHLRTVMDVVGSCVTAILDKEDVANFTELLSRVVARFRAYPVEGSAYSDDMIRAIALAKYDER
jgi:hypothetical protein